MKVTLAMLISLLVGAVAGGFVTYTSTREKWTELGRNSGVIEGRAEVMRALCDLAEKGPPPGEADYILDVKASRLSAVKDGEAVRLYCQE